MTRGLSRDDAAVHPLRNVLTGCVGTQEPLEKNDTGILHHVPEDRVLLSSDSLHKGIGQEEIGAILALPDPLTSIIDLPCPSTLKESTHTADGATPNLVVPAVLKFAPEAVSGKQRVIFAPLYISENPVTNQQYVDFLTWNCRRRS